LNNRKSQRIIRFKEIHNNLLKKSIFYERSVYNWYKSHFERIIDGNNLLFEKGKNWIQKKKNKLINLKDIKINFYNYYNSNVNLNYYKYMKNILPEPKELFAINAFKYLDKENRPDPTFSLKDFCINSTTGDAILDVYLGDYNDFLNTCMPFQYETVQEN